MDKFFEKTLSSKTMYSGKVFDVLHDEVELSDGLIRQRDVVVHSGGVVIVAQKSNGHVLLVNQFRYPIKETELELPAGKLEVGEDPFEAAKRELLEETGYKAQNWISLGFIYTTPGICTEKLYLYKAEELTYFEPNPDDGEIIECFDYKLDQIFEMIKNGTINDSKTICGLMRAFKI